MEKKEDEGKKKARWKLFSHNGKKRSKQTRKSDNLKKKKKKKKIEESYK